jgi:hypothetical protein
MKTNYGANNEETLDSEDAQYRFEESSLIPSPELNGNVKSTRYVKIFAFVVVVAALLGSTLYVSTSVRGNQARLLSSVPEDEKIDRYSTKTVTVGPETTLRNIVDQLIWGNSASNEYPNNLQPNNHEERPKPKPQPSMPPTPNIRSNPRPNHNHNMKPKPAHEYKTEFPTIVPTSPSAITMGTTTIYSNMILFNQLYDHFYQYQKLSQ